MARRSYLERSTIVDHFAEHGWCPRRVAARSGVARATLANAMRLSNKLRRHGVAAPGVLLNGTNASQIER